MVSCISQQPVKIYTIDILDGVLILIVCMGSTEPLWDMKKQCLMHDSINNRLYAKPEMIICAHGRESEKSEIRDDIRQSQDQDIRRGHAAQWGRQRGIERGWKKVTWLLL